MVFSLFGDDFEIDPALIVKIEADIYTWVIDEGEGWCDLVDPHGDFLRAVEEKLCNAFPNAEVEVSPADYGGGGVVAYDSDENEYWLTDRAYAALHQYAFVEPDEKLWKTFEHKPGVEVEDY